MNLGATEIIMIVVIALLFFGPSKLPSIGKSLGDGIRGFKKGMNELQDGMNEDKDKKDKSDHT